MDGHRTAERRSLAYHRAIAERLVAEPTLVLRVRERVTSWRTSQSVHLRYVDAWEAMLARPFDELCAKLSEDSEQMIALRQVSPFVGVLDSRTRWQIWRSVS